jgi:hypothetical protein
MNESELKEAGFKKMDARKVLEAIQPPGGDFFSSSSESLVWLRTAQYSPF